MTSALKPTKPKKDTTRHLVLPWGESTENLSVLGQWSSIVSHLVSVIAKESHVAPTEILPTLAAVARDGSIQYYQLDANPFDQKEAKEESGPQTLELP